MYNCVCGKSHKSRTTVLTHKKKALAIENATGKNVQENSTNERPIVHKNERTNPVQSDKKILRKINLKMEFDKMTETINPKKKEEEKKEKAFECGECHTQFDEKMKFCPGCGCEFL